MMRAPHFDLHYLAWLSLVLDWQATDAQSSDRSQKPGDRGENCTCSGTTCHNGFSQYSQFSCEATGDVCGWRRKT